MPVITFQDFGLGKDLRKGASVSDANRLRELKNGYVTTGKAIRKRPGTTLISRLETGTYGLIPALGKLNTFTESGSITHANALLEAHQVAGSNVNPASFTGSGLNDLTSGGSYTGAGTPTFTVIVDGKVTGSITKFEELNKGSITAMASAGASTTTITSANHGLSNGNSVTISGTTSYNGTFSVSSVATNTFVITDTFVADDATGTWELSPNPLANTTTVTSASHGLSNGMELNITGTTGYNGIFTISGVTTNTFVISKIFTADDATGTWEKIPNTFKWKKDSGSFTTGVAITGIAQDLQEGVQVTFASDFGHTLNDQWTIGISSSVMVSKIHFGDVFNGYIYVTVEYSNGTVLHHYLDGSAITKVTDANCPQTKAAVKIENKIWAINGDNVKFSATGNPRDWTSGSDAGFLAVGLKQRGADNALALGQYQVNKLVVFFKDGAQLWTVDPDPANHLFTQLLPGSSTSYHRGITNLFQDLYFLSDFGFRSISEAALTGNQAEFDIGSPIDSVIQDLLPISSTHTPQAVFNPRLGQYLIAIGQSIFAFTFSRTAKISAWSEYTFPWVISDIAVLNSEVYLRSGDNVYKLDEDSNYDARETGKAITAMASGGTGITTITSAAHGRANGDEVTISGTTNYNGVFTISNVATNTFTIPTAFVANDATGTYIAGTPFEFEMIMSFFDSKRPSIQKMWLGVDTVSTGTASLSFRFDPRDLTLETEPIELTGDTRPGDLVAVEITSTDLAPVIKNNKNELFQLDAISLVYENLTTS